ncbi:MAG: alpha-2-macroglobulin [Phaeodactylibacter sp.]|nr:alpha-2-macroglobulin [Phaeodactylibacter sp.]
MTKQGPYEAEWKTIDSLENEGLPRSALDKVNALYERAKKDEEPAQLVKTIIYSNKYQSQLEESGLAKAIRRMEEEAEAAAFPVQPILYSLAGELYQNYVSQNYWRLANRTTTTGALPDDLETWSLDQLVQQASRYYLLSVEDERTAAIPVAEFDAITFTSKETKNTDVLRPTLYDFLAYRAIGHFADERSYLTQPAYRFYIDQEEAFAPAADFVKAAWNTRDTLSFKYRALELYQNLLRLRLADNNDAALAEADLARLKFVRDNAVLGHKDSLYLGALKVLEVRFADKPQLAEVWSAIASLYAEQGNAYVPGEAEKHKWKLKEAVEVCDKAIERFPESYGARQCGQLRSQLLRETLELKVEEVNLPQQPLLASVAYRNVPKTFFRVIKLEEKERFELDNNRPEELFQDLAARKPLKEWDVELPDDGDHQEHVTEIAVEGLPFGFYAILIADNNRFAFSEQAVGYLFTNVSELGHFSRHGSEDGVEFLMLHRETGAPLEGVLAEFFTTKYNREARRQERVKIGQSRSDKEGFVRPDVSENTYFQVRFSKGQDVLFFQDGFSSYRGSRNQPRRNLATHFFLDRAIYRPGQTIYFKAIVLDRDDKSIPSIVPKHQFTVTFFDVNGQEVAKQELTTNEYGTASGAFTAPQGGLLGQMRLFSDAGNGFQYFSVEEYKRPKFEVVMEPLEGSPALGDTATFKGKATAFAGSSIDGAEVQYRIVREVRYPWFPWWRYGGRGFPHPGESQEIATGQLTTAADGSFSFSFVAQPDLSVDKADKPEFVFTAYVDVTDITGETHSAGKSLNLAYLGLKADVTISESIGREAGLIPVGIVTQNLDGAPLPAEGTLAVNRLEAPKQVFVNRYWNRPDRRVIDEKTFRRDFPHFAYTNEDEPANWPVGNSVLSQPFNTAEEDTVFVNVSGWPVGHYVLNLRTQDDKGNAIEVKKFFLVYDAKERAFPGGLVAWKKQPGSGSYQPGEEASVLLATAAGELNVLYELERRMEVAERKWLQVKPWQAIRHTVGEGDKGNLYAQMSFVKYNRPFTWVETFAVPWKDKQLKIEYNTFRNKLHPGEEEAWQIKVSGPGNDKVAAEMVATLYDASLDQFRPHSWDFSPFPNNYFARAWRSQHFSSASSNTFYYYPQSPFDAPGRTYRSLNWFNFNFYGGGGVRSRAYNLVTADAPAMAEDAIALTSRAEGQGMAKMADSAETVAPPPAPEPAPGQKDEAETPPAPPVRTNLKETVFFFPELRTDEEGNIIIRFKMNEALTRWKFLAMAHTKSLQYALSENEVVTQKELMVLPNPPRFLREGDEIEFTAKVSNLTDEKMAGTAELMLFDALSMQPIDGLFGNDKNTVAFEADGKQSARLAWTLKVPRGEVLAVTHRVVAKAGNFSDGEESALPVLTNRTMVTETMPMPVRGGQSREFSFEAMAKAGKSNTLQHHNFALEFTSNPAWYAVKALPYLMEFPYECSEQIFARYYANALAAAVANSNPAIQQVFEQWKNSDALISELEKNEELKTALLEETPWVRQAQSEAEQRKRIGLLFDLNRMGYEQDKALAQLGERQSGAGGFSWFPGGQDSWYITQYILEGLGRLRALGVQDIQPGTQAWNIAQRAAEFIDGELSEHYERLLYEVKQGRAKLEDDHLAGIVVHYLYARSLFQDIPVQGKAAEAQDYYLGQADKYWLSKGIYQEGLLAIATKRHGQQSTADRITRSLRERALYNDELGMYWNYNAGFFWYEMPIETHALMVEVFSEVAQDADAVEQLKIWLLKNKQTTHWKTTKATANAVYALLRFGDNWLENTRLAEVSFPRLDEETFQPALVEARRSAEAGTGYFKASWSGKEVTPDFSRVKVTNPNNSIAWGAAYWQYFEDLDKVDVFKETPLTLDKQLFKEVIGDRGPELKAITADSPLEPGDKLTVRIELRADRDMEYVHLKDMRASGLEPVNVFSQYKWQGGLGYYESTRDLATHFFIGYLPKGKYVFEYPLRVVHRGDFSNGLASIQCMYAPEFTSHSEGVRVVVE